MIDEERFIMDAKINRLVETSKNVILDCCFENGAIVAANSTKSYYPKEAKNYLYVWPRDASFACVALDILGIRDPQEHFFNWLTNRAEGWKDTGIFYEKYDPNGLQAFNGFQVFKGQALRFQPDQTGTVLFAVTHHIGDNKKEAEWYKELIIGSAQGICNTWRNDHFTLPTNDLWEEISPDLKQNFTYSLAACINGLISANKLFPNNDYVKTANEMKEILLKNAERMGHFFRSFGKSDDESNDSSMLGLIWPFGIVEPKSFLAKNTVKLIEKELVKDYGVYRYEHDEYDGCMSKTLDQKKGAGFWPLLNFWMAIVLNKMGNKEEAIKYYNKVVSLIDEHIPEQVFDNDKKKCVSPLCWSHSMFVIASRELERI